MDDAFHIGQVATRTGLSLRTVRYYESVGLVKPSGRTEGGFRLYSEPDVQRLLLVRSLKHADFSLDQLEEVVRLRDAVLGGSAGADGLARYQAIIAEASHRIRLQRERLVAAELAVELLRTTVSKGPRAVDDASAAQSREGSS